MLGVKTCRAALSLSASQLVLSLSVSARARASPAVWHAGVGPLAACLAMAHVAVPRLTPNTRGRPSVTSYAFKTTIRKDNSPPGPLQTSKTTHQDQYMYGGQLSWSGVVRTQ